MTASTPSELAQLISEVNQLNGNSAAAAREIKALRESNRRLVTSRRRHRLALVLVAIGLTVDLILTILIVRLFSEQEHFNHRQECTNARSQAFFGAEQAKVAGQVAGLRELKNSDGDRAKALEGFNKFIDASQHYLDTIGAIRDRCQ